MMDYEEIEKNYGIDKEAVEKLYNEALITAKSEYPDQKIEVVSKFAEDATLSKIERSKNSVVKIYRGMFLGSDGRVNDFARRDYESAMKQVEILGEEEAKKQGIINAVGQPTYPPNYRFENSRGKVINQDNVFFTVYGVVYEGSGKTIPCEMKVKNLDLKFDLILNTPVSFHAAKTYNKNNLLHLSSTENTQFDYSKIDDDSDSALYLASSRFARIVPKDLPSLVVKTKEKDKEGKEVEVLKTDKRLWLLNEVVVSNISKTDEGRDFYEIIHPEFLGWHVSIITEGVKSAYEILRDKQASFVVKMMKVDEENKEISLAGYGAFQTALLRKPNQKPFNPKSIEVKYEE